MCDSGPLALLANAEVICALLQDVSVETNAQNCATKTCRFVGIIPGTSKQRIIDCYEALRPQVLTYFATMSSTYCCKDNYTSEDNKFCCESEDSKEVCFPNAARWLLLLTYLIYNSPAHYAAWKDRRQMLLSLPVVRQVLQEKVHLALPVPAVCLAELYRKNNSAKNTSSAPRETNVGGDDNDDMSKEDAEEEKQKEALESFTKLQEELDKVMHEWLPSTDLLEEKHVHLEDKEEQQAAQHEEEEELPKKKLNVNEVKDVNALLSTRQRQLADTWHVIAWELSITAVFLAVEHKNFQIWHHRRALLAHGLSLLKNYITSTQSDWHEVIHNSILFNHVLSSICGVELSCINEVEKTSYVFMNIDAKNYHVWLYRHWLLHALPFYLHMPSLQEIIKFYQGSKDISILSDEYRDIKECESNKLADEKQQQQQQLQQQHVQTQNMNSQEEQHEEAEKMTKENVSVNYTSWLESVLAQCSEQDDCHACYGMHKELNFTSELIANDCWNNSAWCHRFRLIRDDVIATWLTQWVEQQCFLECEIMPHTQEFTNASDVVEFVQLVCEEEIHFTLYYLSQYPSNEAAYTYARSIAQVAQQGTLLVRVIKQCISQYNSNSSNEEKAVYIKKSKLLNELYSLVKESRIKRSGNYCNDKNNDDGDVVGDGQLTLKYIIVELLNCNYTSYDNYFKSTFGSEEQTNKHEEEKHQVQEQRLQEQDQFTQICVSDSHTSAVVVAAPSYKKVLYIIHVYMTEVQTLSCSTYVSTLQMPLTLLYKLQRFTLPHVDRVLNEWHEKIRNVMEENKSTTHANSSQELRQQHEQKQKLSKKELEALENSMESDTQEVITKSTSHNSPLHDERYNELSCFLSHNAQYVYDNLHQIYAAQYHVCYTILCQMWNNYFTDTHYRHELEITHSADVYVTRGVNVITIETLQDILSLVKQIQSKQEKPEKQQEFHVFKGSSSNKEPQENIRVATNDVELPIILNLFVRIEGCALSLAKRLVYDDPIRIKYWKHEIYNILFRHYDE